MRLKKLDFSDKNILITGGTGSFGSAAVKKLIEFDPARIVIFSRDEKKQFDMRNRYENNHNIDYIIGDVRDKERVDFAMKNIDYVFHAAALKQVPTCEFFPIEAVKTNVIGSHNVISSAIDNKVKRLVILSTDKAVYPINAMGQTKALMEKVMISSSRLKYKKTILCGVRYGNVMFSRGSVIPLFIEQIKENKDITLTNGQMTRFLLKMDDAIDLIMYALVNGEDGFMYIKKAPAATILNIAKSLKQIFNSNNKIKEIGVRPGEKFHESLLSKEEFARSKNLGDYFIFCPETKEYNYKKYFSNGDVRKKYIDDGYTSKNTTRLGLGETKKLLSGLEEIIKDTSN